MTTKLGDFAPGSAAIAEAAGLLAAWAGDRAAPAPATPVLTLLQVARVHGTVWPLCAALTRAAPAGAPIYAAAMAEADARAEAAFATLTRAAADLNAAGLTPVALKGAVFPALTGRPAPWRSMADVDLLVPPAALPRAIDALGAAGWRGRDHDRLHRRIWGCYAHPPLVPPGGGAALELHVRCSYEHGGVLAGLADRARPSALPGLRVPSAEDRLAHLVHQVQLMDRGAPRRVVRLRDALDWRLIRRDDPADLDATAHRFRKAGHAAAFAGFAALMGRLWAEPDLPAPDAEAVRWADAEAVRWADEALAGMADPASLARFLPADYRRAAVEVLTRPGMTWEFVSRFLLSSTRPGAAARAGRLLRRVALGRRD